jgi:hypothetical protein
MTNSICEIVDTYSSMAQFPLPPYSFYIRASRCQFTVPHPVLSRLVPSSSRTCEYFSDANLLSTVAATSWRITRHPSRFDCTRHQRITVAATHVDASQLVAALLRRHPAEILSFWRPRDDFFLRLAPCLRFLCLQLVFPFYPQRHGGTRSS